MVILKWVILGMVAVKTGYFLDPVILNGQTKNRSIRRTVQEDMDPDDCDFFGFYEWLEDKDYETDVIIKYP